ncbi:MAG: hypothetical protein XE11_2161, partial [Methanomicrobiales archaeon 53_19]
MQFSHRIIIAIACILAGVVIG